MGTTELERVRAICLGLPEVTERLSHGSPTWFVRDKKTFVTYLDDHHGDGRLAHWCAAPEGMQEALVAGELEHYFRPPYVGHRGWIGVHLNRGLEIAGAIGGRLLHGPSQVARRAGRDLPGEPLGGGRQRRLGELTAALCAVSTSASRASCRDLTCVENRRRVLVT